jgi:hypothetical protein
VNDEEITTNKFGKCPDSGDFFVRPIVLLLGGILLIVGAVVHGATTHRWAGFQPGAERSEKLHNLVIETGDYQAEVIPNDLPLKEKSTATCRRYFSPSRSQYMIVSMITGPAGAVTTHTPDVCYPASGYKLVKAVRRETIDLPGNMKANYYVADFEKKTATSVERQRVRWMWSNSGNWEAPERPRLKYLDLADVAKLYIVTPITESEPQDESLAARQFITAVLVQYSGLFAGR